MPGLATCQDLVDVQPPLSRSRELANNAQAGVLAYPAPTLCAWPGHAREPPSPLGQPTRARGCPIVIDVLVATEMRSAAALLRHRAIGHQRPGHSVKDRCECALNLIRYGITGRQLQ